MLILHISACLIQNFSFLCILFTKLYKKNCGANIVIPVEEIEKVMNVKNISSGYIPPANNRQSNNSGCMSVMKPVLYTYLTALALLPVPQKDYFEKQAQLQDIEEKIKRSPFTNEPDTFLYERFSDNTKNKNIFYQLKLANQTDFSQMEKISDDKFIYTIRIDNKRIDGKVKFVDEDRVIFGTSAIRDLNDEKSKVKKFKFKIVLPQDKSKSFILKILDNTNPGEKNIYKLTRKNDGSLILHNKDKEEVLNPVNTKVNIAIKDIENSLVEDGIKIEEAKDNQNTLRLILAIVFFMEFLAGKKESTSQE